MRMLLVALAFVACSGPKAPPPSTPPSTPTATGECPPTAPAHSSSCARYLTKCTYPNEPRCPFSHCADVASQLFWQTTYDHCPIECPAAKPTAGTSCSPVTSQACHYKGGAMCGYRMRCTATGWTEEELTLCDGM